MSAGASSHSARTAFTTIVNGLMSANVWSQLGIESVGTNADDANVSGKITRKPTDCADSGLLAIIPISAKNHENA